MAEPIQDDHSNLPPEQMTAHSGKVVTLYEPFDQTAWLGRAPWDDTPALKAWEQAHGHDVRLKCYVEFGCQVIEPTLERRIDRLVAERDRLMERSTVQAFDKVWAERDRLIQALERIRDLRPNSGSSLDACIDIAREALTKTKTPVPGIEDE